MSDGMMLGDVLAEVQMVPERLPVLNREPRTAIGKELRRGLWLRDGGTCWICGHAAIRPVADHVRPRSNWPSDLIDAADRSDNLRLACWTCNETKSNMAYSGGESPLGITRWCVRCEPEFLHDDEVADVRCFCIRCGMGGLVPDANVYLYAEDSCPDHSGYPLPCDRCAETAVA